MGANPLRRIRVRYLDWHYPKTWAAYWEPPGSCACYCHAPTLDAMWGALAAYFNGEGYCPPLRVEDRMMRYLRPSDIARTHKEPT